MKFAVVAHRRSATNEALVAAARAWGLESELLDPHTALTSLEPGDVALGRLDVREGLDGIERGTGELERLAAGGVDVRNPPGTLVVAHDKLLTARALRLAGLPHPHTTLAQPDAPHARPRAPGRAQAAVRQLGTRRRAVHDLGRARRSARPAAAEAVVPRARRARAGARRAERWDLRLVVAGGRVVGAACRIARSGEWRTNAALGAQVEPVEPPPLARALALAAAQAARADLVGVDLLPTPNGGFVVLELNGAVDFRPVYAPLRDVFSETVAALLEDGVRQPELAAASV